MSENFRKELAQRLAETLSEGNTLPLLQLLCQGESYVDWQNKNQGLGPFASLADDMLGLMSSLSTDKPSVGIWEQDLETGDFVRSHAHVDLWRFCADVNRIPKKGERKRVVFLGESVARGFFFDPFYSPAGVLQEILSSAGTQVEIIDLAQSNCDPWWLSVVASRTKLLSPDVIVVFAGNNWRGDSLANISAEYCGVDGTMLTADRGFLKLLARQRQRLDLLATQTVELLSVVAAEAGIPLVLIIPEVNIVDWETCPVGTLDVPLMSGEDTFHWVAVYRQASEAIKQGAFDKAERLASEAVDLDGGSSAASLMLLARSQFHQNNIYKATATLRRSRDLTLCYLDGTRPVPGIFSNVVEKIRSTASKNYATIVDLPQVFAEHLQNDSPGRQLFMDYCHLSSEGIRLSMAATAQVLLPLLSSETTKLAELFHMAPSPSNEQESWGHLLAGIHNAHWGQREEICSYHFRHALEIYPPLETMMWHVYNAFRHATPPPLMSSFNELVQNKTAAVYLLGYGIIFRELGLVSEHRLLQSLIAASPSLEKTSQDPDFVLGKISEIDLLSPHWSELTDGNRWFRRGFTAVYGLESVFPFICDDPQHLSIKLTYRVPGACETGNLSIKLNGCIIESFSADQEWRSEICTVEPSLVKQGLNQLILCWPNVKRKDLRPQIRKNFEMGRAIDIRTHFGELYEACICIKEQSV